MNPKCRTSEITQAKTEKPPKPHVQGYLLLMEYAEYEYVWNECVKRVCDNTQVVRVEGRTDCLWLLAVGTTSLALSTF